MFKVDFAIFDEEILFFSLGQNNDNSLYYKNNQLFEKPSSSLVAILSIKSCLSFGNLVFHVYC